MLVAGERSAAVDLRAMLPDDERRGFRTAIAISRARLRRSSRPARWRILLGTRPGREARRRASGDSVLVVIAQGNVTPAGVAPRMRRFTVAGLIDAGMYEFDQGLALMHLDDARRLYRLGDASRACATSSTTRMPPASASAPSPSRLTGPLLHQRLEPPAGQLLPLDPGDEVHHVLRVAAGGRGGRLQHHLDARDGREREARRHRDPAHARRFAARHADYLHDPGHRSSAWSALPPACARAAGRRQHQAIVPASSG